MYFPTDLLEAFDPIDGKGVIAFMGSGPSIAAGLPSWPDLLWELALEQGREEDIRPSLGDGRFLDIAQYLVGDKSEAALQEKVSEIFRRRQRWPSIVHERTVELPFRGIVTTNYDLLLSDADRQRRFERPISHRTSGLTGHLRRRFVFHLHGHVDDPVTIVLSKDSYDRFASGLNREAIQFLRTVFQLHVVLFIGFGFRDLNVDTVLREMQDLGIISGWNVYALVPCPDPANPDKVLESALHHRSINAVFLAQGSDHGMAALADWLGSLLRAVNAIAGGRLRPFVEEPQYALVVNLKELLTAREYEPHLRQAIAGLADRPDLQRVIRGPLDGSSLMDLLGRIDLQEARLLFTELNKARRDPRLEQILSTLPPLGLSGSSRARHNATNS